MLKSILGSRDYNISKLCNYGITITFFFRRKLRQTYIDMNVALFVAW